MPPLSRMDAVGRGCAYVRLSPPLACLPPSFRPPSLPSFLPPSLQPSFPLSLPPFLPPSLPPSLCPSLPPDRPPPTLSVSACVSQSV
jgi:hypothetical protein